MSLEREAFENFYETTRDYKFYVRHEMTKKQTMEFKNGKYSVSCVNDAWLVWQAATQREGFKFVPVEPTERMIDAGMDEHSYNECHSDVPDIYKAMIGEV